ncbi:MAG: DUF721 domain-containing protein [Chitinivibrionales bacterium]|nr:DUF721 domain-containing protein [Chitinivibrionales bacterium]
MIFNQRKNKLQPGKHPPQRLSNILDSVLKDKGYFKAYCEIEVVHNWRSLVGDTIADVTSCIEVRDGILFVKVLSSSWRHEISFIKQDILKTIRQNSRCNTITDIIFC